MTLWLACCSSLCLKPSPWLMEKARRALGWLPASCHKRALAGFTLAELLISLAILGVIATFTIPAILARQQAEKNIAVIKETMSMVSQAYATYSSDNTPTASTTFGEITPYMNYANTDNSTLIDTGGGGAYTCTNPSVVCLKLHNGATLLFWKNVSFSGTSNLNALWYSIDPDGISNATNRDALGAGIWCFLYFNGRVSTHGSISTGTTSSDGSRGPISTADPSWFQW